MNKFCYKTLFTAFLIVLFSGQSLLQAQSFSDVENAIRNEKYQAALNLIAQKLGEDPKNSTLYYLKGQALYKNEQFGEAKASFKKGKGYASREPWNYIGLGGSLARENNFMECKENLDRALSLNKTKDSDILIAVANAYLKSDKMDFLKEAEVLLYKVKELDKDNVHAYIALGDMYNQQRINALALSHYQEAIGLDPNFMKGWLRVGQIRVKNEEFQEGADAFMKAIEIDPNFAPPYKDLGELWYKAGKYENAKKNYAKYVSLTDGDLSAQMRYGSFLYLTKNYDEAITVMEKVLVDTSSLVMHRLMGYSYAEKGDASKAKDYMTKYFAKVKSEDIIAKDYECKAKIAELNKDRDAQFENYEKVIALDSSRTDLYGLMGDILFKEKDYVKAAGYFQKAIESGNAKFKQYFFNGLSHYFSGDSVAADTAFGTIVDRYPTEHFGYLYKARLAAKKDLDSKLGLAKPYYEKVNEILGAKDKLTKQKTNDLVESIQYMAYYYYVAEDCPSSVPYWEKYLEFKPENEDAKKIIEYCNSK